MLLNPSLLIEQFVEDVHKYCGINVSSYAIVHDIWCAPHVAKSLPPNTGAVYVFSFSSISISRAGKHKVLKIGKAGPNSNNRFQYQHYLPTSANSTLSGAIVNNPILWGFIDYPGGNTDISRWIKQNTDRDNFYFTDERLIGLFEVYAKAHLGSIFEGSLSSKT